MEQVTVDLAAVVMAVTEGQPRLLTVIQHDGVSALPAGPA